MRRATTLSFQPLWRLLVAPLLLFAQPAGSLVPSKCGGAALCRRPPSFALLPYYSPPFSLGGGPYYHCAYREAPPRHRSSSHRLAATEQHDNDLDRVAHRDATAAPSRRKSARYWLNRLLNPPLDASLGNVRYGGIKPPGSKSKGGGGKGGGGALTLLGRAKKLHNPITYLVLALLAGLRWDWCFRNPYYWFGVAFCVKWYRARYVFKIPVWDRQPNWNNIITSKEQEKDLKAYTCKNCGSTLFIAKSREFFFEGGTGIGGLGCFSCGAKGKDNFVMDRDRIVEDVADMDDYFEYERPLDFVSAAERRKLLKESGGDEDKANLLLLQRTTGIKSEPVEEEESAASPAATTDPPFLASPTEDSANATQGVSASSASDPPPPPPPSVIDAEIVSETAPVADDNVPSPTTMAAKEEPPPKPPVSAAASKTKPSSFDIDDDDLDLLGMDG